MGEEALGCNGSIEFMQHGIICPQTDAIHGKPDFFFFKHHVGGTGIFTHFSDKINRY